jgi:hypothetical protein
VFWSFCERKLLQFCFNEVMFESLSFFNTSLCCSIIDWLYLVVVLASLHLNLAYVSVLLSLVLLLCIEVST